MEHRTQKWRNLKINWRCIKYILSKNTLYPGSIIVAIWFVLPGKHIQCQSMSFNDHVCNCNIARCIDAPWTIWPPHIILCGYRRVVHRFRHAWRPGRVVKTSGAKMGPAKGCADIYVCLKKWYPEFQRILIIIPTEIARRFLSIFRRTHKIPY